MDEEVKDKHTAEEKNNEKQAEESCFPHREYQCGALSCITVGFSLGIAATIAIIKLMQAFK